MIYLSYSGNKIDFWEMGGEIQFRKLSKSFGLMDFYMAVNFQTRIEKINA